VDRRKTVGREARQGRRNDTARDEDDPARVTPVTLARERGGPARKRVDPGGETATPHRSKSKKAFGPGRTLSPIPLKQKGAYGGHLALAASVGCPEESVAVRFQHDEAPG